MALTVVIEGIDGSGKGTQAQRLHSRLQQLGKPAALISFPRYTETLFGQVVGEFLNGRFGSLEQVDPFLAALLYAGDRYESRPFLLEAQRTHDVVVLDRYVPSNVAHQAAKRDGPEREELVDRIMRVEHDVYEMPKPDLVLLLDLPVRLAQRLIAAKSRRDYTDRPADLQEADADYLERVRQLYLQLADGERNWHTVTCTRDEQIRSIEEIGNEIWDVVQSRRGTEA